MPVFEYDFKERTERIWDSMPGNGQALGRYVCKVLSADYEALSHRVASLLNEYYMKHLPYPDAEVSAMLADMFEGLIWDELGKRTLGLKNIYTATQGDSRDTKDTILRWYDSMEEYYYCEILDDFEVIIVLQAYLEESVETPDMLIPEKFDLFISGVFDDKVTLVSGKCKSVVSSEPELLYDSDVRKVVRDMFFSLMPLNTNRVVMQTTSLNDFVASSIFYFFRNGYRFNRCKNCGQFFIPFSRSDELYCDRPSPQDESRSCKQYGSERLWYDKLKKDEAAKLARNIYMSKQMLVRRNPDILGYKKMFDYFKTERKKWEALVKSGTKSKEEYINWLNEMKAKKTL